MGDDVLQTAEEKHLSLIRATRGRVPGRIRDPNPSQATQKITRISQEDGCELLKIDPSHS